MTSTPWAPLLAGSIAVLVVLLWRKLSGPSPIRLSSQVRVREVLRTTLRNGARGARLRMQLTSNPRLRVDFRKYFADDGAVGLRAVLEQSPQLATRLSVIKEVLERRGLHPVLATDSKGRESLEIDVASDLLLAETVAYGVFEDALGLSLARDVIGIYDLVLITNEPSITGVNED